MFRTDTEDASKKSVRFYVTEKLSSNMARTPEGFLLCSEVPIARTGNMIYGPNETPIEVGPDGFATIERDSEEVFRTETIASFNGKPVTNNHPDEDVTPDNWKQLAIGVVLDPRRGSGAKDDLLLADLLITDADAILDIQDGKREVSCGYDAGYEETSPGHGRQINIIGNHVALVQNARCGPVCSIRDSAYGGNMSEKKSWKDKIREAFKTKDCDSMEKVLNEVKDEEAVGGGGVHLHLNQGGAPAGGEGGRSKYSDEKLDEMFSKNDERHEAHDKKFKAHDEDIKALRGNGGAEEDEDEGEDTKEIEGDLEEEAPEGTGDKAKKAKDSAFLDDSFKATVAMAEIIAPGISIPTFDRASKPGASLKVICGLRRKALQAAVKDEDTLEFVKQVRRGRTLDDAQLKGMSCSQVRDLFFSVGSLKKAANNNSATQDTDDGIRAAGGGMGTKLTPAEINKRNREFYSKR